MMFWAPAVIALLTTALAITRSNPVHALLWFVLSLLAMAIIFFGLGAAFAAALEVIVYAGAVVVLFLFVVMMLSLDRAAALREKIFMARPVWTVPVIFVSLLSGAIGFAMFRHPLPPMPGQPVPPRQVALALFSGDLPVVELASLLLLAGLVAAFHLGREAEK
jgi:NADH-quinone oxidoreductase subunit J